MVKTEAIILKSADLGETDRLLTIYSKEFGKIQVAARGTKKLESKLRYHLEPINYSHLILIEGKNFRIVKDAVLINQYLSMRRDLEKMKIAYKIGNLIDELIVGEEKDEEIWSLLLEAFKKLDIDAGPYVGFRKPYIYVGFPKPYIEPCIVKEFQDDLLTLLGYDPGQVKSLADVY